MKKLDRPSASQELCSTAALKFLSAITDYNIKEICLFCGKPASSRLEKHKKCYNRKTIIQVSTISIKEKIMSKAVARTDNWGEEI